MKNYLLNKPLFAVFLVSIVIAIQFAISREYPVLNLPRFLSEKSDPADLISLTVALSTVSAIIAGFAGVVIVLGLSSENEKFRAFRLLAGNNLESNWTSIARNSFLSSFLGIGCLIFVLIGNEEFSMWVLEFAFLLALDATLRILYLLRTLAKLVSSQDRLNQNISNQTPVTQIVKKSNRDGSSR